MHLAIVSPYPPEITGIGQYGYYISRSLANTGAFSRITLLTSRKGAAREFEAAPRVDVERIWQSDRIDIGGQILARLFQIQPDIVWFNLGTTIFGRTVAANISGLLCPALVHRLGLPSVLTMHEMAELADLRLLKAPGGPLRSLGSHWVTWALTQADVVCLTLKHYTEWLARRQPGRRFIHIPHGLFNEPEFLEYSENPELLFFTTLAPYKGLELLLEALRLLHDRFPHLILTVAGAEHSRFPGYLARLQQDYQSVTDVRWLGYVPEVNIRELFRRCQMVVLPYTAATGSSSVLYRAMVWGRNIVASDIPELRSTVEEVGLKAEFFSSGNVPDLADAIERLLRSRELRERQVQCNYQAINRLRLDDTCRAYLQAFNLALKMHRTSVRIPIPAEITTESA